MTAKHASIMLLLLLFLILKLKAINFTKLDKHWYKCGIQHMWQ